MPMFTSQGFSLCWLLKTENIKTYIQHQYCFKKYLVMLVFCLVWSTFTSQWYGRTESTFVSMGWFMVLVQGRKSWFAFWNSKCGFFFSTHCHSNQVVQHCLIQTTSGPGKLLHMYRYVYNYMLKWSQPIFHLQIKKKTVNGKCNRYRHEKQVKVILKFCFW